jgi:hypothetical protein
MFMMDPPSTWELLEAGALPGLCWIGLWVALSWRAVRSERRRELMAYWIASCVLGCWLTLCMLSVPVLGIACFWAPLGPLVLGAVSLKRLFFLRDRGRFEW